MWIQAEMPALNDLNKAWNGAIIPHIILQELVSLNDHLHKKTKLIQVADGGIGKGFRGIKVFAPIHIKTVEK